jgi:DNA-binding HxlR family transcriptional regulator
MNLKLSRDLLAAADEQPHESLQVSGREATREVELLANAGFVEATLQPQGDPPTAVIKQLTDAGRKLLRVLRDQLPEKSGGRPEAAGQPAG